MRVVLDNLNTHRMASLYETFPAPEARRIAKRLEFHYTPKHGSWLNMAGNRVQRTVPLVPQTAAPRRGALGREVQALVTERNTAQATINWRFNTHDARTKLHRLYPFDSKHDYRVTEVFTHRSRPLPRADQGPGFDHRMWVPVRKPSCAALRFADRNAR